MSSWYRTSTRNNSNSHQLVLYIKKNSLTCFKQPRVSPNTRNLSLSCKWRLLWRYCRYWMGCQSSFKRRIHAECACLLLGPWPEELVIWMIVHGFSRCPGHHCLRHDGRAVPQCPHFLIQEFSTVGFPGTVWCWLGPWLFSQLIPLLYL